MVRDRRKRVLVAGGGVAALEAVLTLRELASELAVVELLAPDPRFTYQPMSVAEPFGLGEAVHLDLDALASDIGAQRIPAGLTGIDAWRHVAHTTTNLEVPYDVLLIACGALTLPAVPGAETFRGASDVAVVGRLLDELVTGAARSVAFVIPWGAVWSLPAYELAVLTAAYLGDRHAGGIELTVVTPEAEPLQVFGPPASKAMRELLVSRGIALRSGTYARSFADGSLELAPGPQLAIDRALTLPRLEGAPLDGIPQTLAGFVPVDAHCRVHGLQNVYAAGDITSFTVKQGGIAAQQADAAAEAIAAGLGADVDPAPFRPIIRGLLLTGRAPRYLRRELSGRPEFEPEAAYDPLWWPPAKIVGRRLAPFLASILGHEHHAPPVPPGAIEIESDLTGASALQLAPRIAARLDGSEAHARVEAVMSEPVVVAPEDTLGEVAERLVAHDARAVTVVEDGHPIGILTTSDVVAASAARVQPAEARARLWMTAEPVTVPPDYPLSAAAVLMGDYGIHHLPVVEGESVVGMVELDSLPGASGTEAELALYGMSSATNGTSST